MILVTGATGFIGRRFIRRLAQVKNKEKIVCLAYEKCDTELEQTGRAGLDELGIRYIPVDLISGSGLDKAPKSPELVFHIASITDTSARDHSVNDVGTRNLVEAIKPLGPKTHFVFTSTIALMDVRPDYSVPNTEYSGAPDFPRNEYGRRKLLAENYLKECARQMKFPLSIIRVSCVYGDGARKNGLFDNIHKLALKQSFLSRMNWPGKMSLIHVDDMAELIYRASEAPPAPGEHELYIPSVEELTLADMSRKIHEAYGIPYKPANVPAFFWKSCAFFAARKHIFERLLPHETYNRFWQACLLVNNEFWNRAEKMYHVVPDWKPLRYDEYYKEKAKATAKTW